MKLSPPGGGSLMSANQWLPAGRLAMKAARFMPCHCPRFCSAKAASRGMVAGLGHTASQIASAVWRGRFEHFAVTAVAFEVLLAVDVAAIAAHRRMAYPPPTRDDDCRFSRIGHR